MQKIEVTHDFVADQWDWPLQHNDGRVDLQDTEDKWEADLDMAYFNPKEIEVKVMGDKLTIHAQHDLGTFSHEINRSYKLPESVNARTIKSHFNQKGVLRITAEKNRT